MLSNPPPSLTSPPWSDRTKRTVVLITGGLLFLLVLQLLQAWTIIILAVILAYLLNPIVNLIEQELLRPVIPFKAVRRSLAVVLTLILVVVVLVLIVIVIVPPLAAQSQDFITELPDIVSSYEQEVQQTLSRPIKLGNQTIIPWDEIVNATGGDESAVNFDVVTAVQQTAATLSSPVLDLATVAVSVVFNFLFMVVTMFYMMKDGAYFVERLEQITPVEYQGDVQRLIYELGRIWNAYLRGQLLLGFIIGLETTVAATLLGLPQPLVLGLLAGLFEFIPNIGPFLSSLPAILFALISPSATIPGLDGLLFALVVFLTYVVIQQTEQFFLVPRVMGHSLDLHPLAILIGVLSGTAIAGLLGIILAAPVLATLRLLLTYIWGKLTDIDPFTKATKIEFQELPHEAVLYPTRIHHALNSPPLPEHSGEIIED
jgi:predicted PurR-regulated permease PerM